LNKKEERFFELEGKEKTENSTFRLISQLQAIKEGIPIN